MLTKTEVGWDKFLSYFDLGKMSYEEVRSLILPGSPRIYLVGASRSMRRLKSGTIPELSPRPFRRQRAISSRRVLAFCGYNVLIFNHFEPAEEVLLEGVHIGDSILDTVGENSPAMDNIMEAEMEAVILDMDGVLVDSEPLHLEATNRVLAAFGEELSEADSHAFLGRDDRDLFEELKVRFSLTDSVSDLISAREGAVLDLIREGIVPRPGVPELIVGLKMRGYLMAVASSSFRAVVSAMLDELGLARSFDAIVTGEDVERGKPEPDIFLAAAETLGVEPAECLVFEDALHGVRAALAAGMTAVAVRTRENHHIPFEEAFRVYDGFERFDWALLDDR